MMRRHHSRLTLYWLTDKEWFLGEIECVRVSSRWTHFLSNRADGTLFLASDHLFFDDGGPTVVVFPLSNVTGSQIECCDEYFSVRFLCESAIQREVLTPTREGHSIPGICKPYQNKEKWVFHFARTAEWAVESIRSLFSRHRIDDLLSRREVALQSASSAVSFCVRRQVPMREQRGILYIGDADLVFEPLFPLPSHDVVTLNRNQCRHTFARWIIFEAVGLDVCTADSLDVAPALSLIFKNPSERDQAVHLISRRLGISPYQVSIQVVMEAWGRRFMSTYEYLLHLNKWASRCANDASQYPIFPWILADYTSSELDISRASTFRDLSKPIGALSPSRLALLKERAEFLREAEETEYLYSAHYSSAGIVAYYLVRPHPELLLSLQGGNLDLPERIMESIPQLWRGVTSKSSNFRELIPQFFNSEFLAMCGPPLLPLGVHANGSPVAAYIQLPPWAESSEDFVRQHRNALESEIVSASIHLWIDLIFGVAQTGEQACAAANLFHPFSYPQRKKQVCVPGLHLSAHEYAREFGNVPIQLFADAHPQRAEHMRVPVSTAEALEACGCSGESAGEQRLLRIMEELQSMDDTLAIADTAVKGEEGAYGLPTHAAALSILSSTSLACRSSHFITLGYTEDKQQPISQIAELLIVGSDKQTATLFDVKTGSRIRYFPDFDGFITTAAFHDGNMFVFTENMSCYVLSLASNAVAHVATAVTPGPVILACFTSQLVVLADSNAQLSCWTPKGGKSHLVFESPHSFTSEACSPVVSMGRSMDGDVVVAATEQFEVFVFHGGTCYECILQQVSGGSRILHIIPADTITHFWVCFVREAALYDLGGLPLKHITYTPVSIMVSPCLARQVYPICVHLDENIPQVFELLHTGAHAEPLPFSPLRSLQTCSAGSLVAFVGTAFEDTEQPLVLTLAQLTV